MRCWRRRGGRRSRPRRLAPVFIASSAGRRSRTAGCGSVLTRHCWSTEHRYLHRRRWRGGSHFRRRRGRLWASPGATTSLPRSGRSGRRGVPRAGRRRRESPGMSPGDRRSHWEGVCRVGGRGRAVLRWLNAGQWVARFSMIRSKGARRLGGDGVSGSGSAARGCHEPGDRLDATELRRDSRGGAALAPRSSAEAAGRAEREGYSRLGGTSHQRSVA